jgi:hypothetical protein
MTKKIGHCSFTSTQGAERTTIIIIDPYLNRISSSKCTFSQTLVHETKNISTDANIVLSRLDHWYTCPSLIGTAGQGRRIRRFHDRADEKRRWILLPSDSFATGVDKGRMLFSSGSGGRELMSTPETMFSRESTYSTADS